MEPIDIAKARSAALIASIDYSDHYYYPRTKKSHTHSEKKKKYKNKLGNPIDYNDIIINHSKLPNEIALFNGNIYKPIELLEKIRNHPIFSKISSELWKSNKIWMSGLSVLDLIITLGCSKNKNNEIEIWMYHHSNSERNDTLRMLEEFKPLMLEASKPLQMAPDRIKWTMYNGYTIIIRLTSKSFVSVHESFKNMNTFDVFECLYDGTNIYSSGEQLITMLWNYGCIYKLPQCEKDSLINEINNVCDKTYYNKLFNASDLLYLLSTGFKITNEILALLYNLKFYNYNYSHIDINDENIIACNICKCIDVNNKCEHKYWNECINNVLHTRTIEFLQDNIKYLNIYNNTKEYNNYNFSLVLHKSYKATEEYNTPIDIEYNIQNEVYNNSFEGIDNKEFFRLYTIYSGYDLDIMFKKFPMYIIKYNRYRKEELSKLFRVDNEFGFGFIDILHYKQTETHTKTLEEYNIKNSNVISISKLSSLKTLILSKILNYRNFEDMLEKYTVNYTDADDFDIMPTTQFIQSIISNKEITIEEKLKQIEDNNDLCLTKICERVGFTLDNIKIYLKTNKPMNLIIKQLKIIQYIKGNLINDDHKYTYYKYNIELLENTLELLNMFSKTIVRKTIARLIFQLLEILQYLKSDTINRLCNLIISFKANILHYNYPTFYNIDKIHIKRQLNPHSLHETISIYYYI